MYSSGSEVIRAALIQSDWCLYKQGRSRRRPAQRDPGEDTGRRWHLPVRKRGLRRTQPCDTWVLDVQPPAWELVLFNAALERRSGEPTPSGQPTAHMAPGPWGPEIPASLPVRTATCLPWTWQPVRTLGTPSCSGALPSSLMGLGTPPGYSPVTPTTTRTLRPGSQGAGPRPGARELGNLAQGPGGLTPGPPVNLCCRQHTRQPLTVRETEARQAKGVAQATRRANNWLPYIPDSRLHPAAHFPRRHRGSSTSVPTTCGPKEVVPPGRDQGLPSQL